MTKNNSPLIRSGSNRNKIKQSANSVNSRLANSQLNENDVEPMELDDWRDKIYTIAILLTGCADDAQQVVDEVMEALQSESSEANETLETRVHRLAYDSSLVKLLVQVDRKTSKLEEASKNILTASNFLS